LVAFEAREAFLTIVFAAFAAGAVALTARFVALAAVFETEAVVFFAFTARAVAALAAPALAVLRDFFGVGFEAGAVAFFFGAGGDFLTTFLAVVLRVVTRFVGMELPRPPGRRFGRRSRQLLRLA
jgi:hypothetical protein